MPHEPLDQSSVVPFSPASTDAADGEAAGCCVLSARRKRVVDSFIEASSAWIKEMPNLVNWSWPATQAHSSDGLLKASYLVSTWVIAEDDVDAFIKCGANYVVPSLILFTDLLAHIRAFALGTSTCSGIPERRVADLVVSHRCFRNCVCRSQQNQ